MKCKYTQCLLFALNILFVSGCMAMHQTKVYRDGSDNLINPVKAPPELVEKIRKKGWLEEGITVCNFGRVSMKKQDFQDCVLVYAALLPPFDPGNREQFGLFYDPKKFYECRVKGPRANANCRRYRLRRREPEPVWPYTDVPPLKWPEPSSKAVYQEGMSSKAYFAELCEKEAGKFIYRTVDDVEGVYQIRPRRPKSDIDYKDPFIHEDPYHYSISEDTKVFAGFLGKQRYRFIETAIYDIEAKPWQKYWHETIFNQPNQNDKYTYYAGYDNHLSTLRKKYSKDLQSKYGYVWRGIQRKKDRENGIAGGELAIVDLASNEVLALWRGFLRSGMKNNGQVWWVASKACPEKEGAYLEEIYDFVSSVLKPKVVQ